MFIMLNSIFKSFLNNTLYDIQIDNSLTWKKSWIVFKIVNICRLPQMRKCKVLLINWVLG